jgi:hypothetical protein
MSKYESTRKIKCLGDRVKPGSFYIHPITLEVRQNLGTTDIYPSGLHNSENNKLGYSINTCKEKNTHIDIQNFMALPYLNLHIQQILDMYNIRSVDDLTRWVDKQIEDKMPFNYINRIINIWLNASFDTVTDYNKLISKIYQKLASNYWSKLNRAHMDTNKLESLIDKFINDWLNTIKRDDFIFDLGKDLKKYLHKQSKG